MPFGRLLIAWIVVALWFGIATFATTYLVSRIVAPGSGDVFVGLPLLKWRLAEAALITLIAALWFDSLGSGGWLLLFALIGLLATVPSWFLEPRGEFPGNARIAGAIADVSRYIAAGALLAWRLS